MAEMTPNTGDIMQSNPLNQNVERAVIESPAVEQLPSARPRLADVIKNQHGMTLVEIMIVVTIMASIMGVVGVFVFGALDKANIKEAQIQIGNYHNMVEQYYLVSDPHTLPGNLQDLVTREIATGLKGDPWGNDYVYNKTGGRDFEISSAGPDGQMGTEDDISNKAKE